MARMEANEERKEGMANRTDFSDAKPPARTYVPLCIGIFSLTSSWVQISFSQPLQDVKKMEFDVHAFVSKYTEAVNILIFLS